MNSPATVKTSRRPLVVSLSCALLLCLLGTSAAAQDDDWGLPTTVNNNDPDSSSNDDHSADDGSSGGESQELQTYDLLVFAELVGGIDPASGTLEIDKYGGIPTGLLVTESAAQAEVVAQDVAQPVAMSFLDDGVLLQGDLFVQLHDGLTVTLRAPDVAIANVGLLVVDDGSTSLAAMLDAALAGQASAAVSGHVILGELSALDLGALAQLAQAAEGSVAGTHLSVLVATLDDLGALHLGGARVPMAGGILEVAHR